VHEVAIGSESCAPPITNKGSVVGVRTWESGAVERAKCLAARVQGSEWNIYNFPLSLAWRSLDAVLDPKTARLPVRVSCHTARQRLATDLAASW